MHLDFMKEALLEARAALMKDEVPIGAIVVLNNEIISRAHNQVEELQDPTAHAEILAIQKAAKVIGNCRLLKASLYVTIEPCPMCAGALVLSRVERLIYGADDPRAGSCGSIVDLVREPRLNHRLEVVKGIMAEECKTIMQEFFKQKRKSG